MVAAVGLFDTHFVEQMYSLLVALAIIDLYKQENVEYVDVNSKKPIKINLIFFVYLLC
jgi:hypothetical protein